MLNAAYEKGQKEGVAIGFAQGHKNGMGDLEETAKNHYKKGRIVRVLPGA